MKAALLVLFSIFFTMASAMDHDKETAMECLNIASFQYKNEEGEAKAQCIPSLSLGAFYRDDGSRWECFPGWDDEPHWPGEEQFNDAINRRFAGICKFGDFESTKTKEDIELCSHKALQCSPGPQKYWGACVSPDIRSWMCIEHDDRFLPDYVKGDCRTMSTAHGSTIWRESTNTEELYQGVCRFATKNEADHPKPVKCPADIAREGQKAACFGIKVDVEGNARAQPVYYYGTQREKTPEFVCEWQRHFPNGYTTGGGRFYDGECLFETHEDYEKAPDWSTIKPTRDTPPYVPVDPAPTEAENIGIGAGWIIVFVFVLLAVGGGGFLLWQRARQQKPRVLSGGLMR